MQKRGLFLNLSTSQSNGSQPFRGWRAPFNKIAPIRGSNLDCKMLKKKIFLAGTVYKCNHLVPPS